jgi:hypothetical protein
MEAKEKNDIEEILNISFIRDEGRSFEIGFQEQISKPGYS